MAIASNSLPTNSPRSFEALLNLSIAAWSLVWASFSFLISFSSFSCCCFLSAGANSASFSAGAWSLAKFSSATFNSASRLARFWLVSMSAGFLSSVAEESDVAGVSGVSAWAGLAGCAALAASNFAFNSATFASAAFRSSFLLSSVEVSSVDLPVKALSSFLDCSSWAWRAALILSNWAFPTLRAMRSRFTFKTELISSVIVKLVKSVLIRRPYWFFLAFPFSSTGSVGTGVVISNRNVSFASFNL